MAEWRDGTIDRKGKAFKNQGKAFDLPREEDGMVHRCVYMSTSRTLTSLEKENAKLASLQSHANTQRNPISAGRTEEHTRIPIIAAQECRFVLSVPAIVTSGEA